MNDLEHHLQWWQTDHKPGLVLLMEGADPIVLGETCRVGGSVVCE